MIDYQPSDAVQRIRGQIEHPIIDSDGHLIEFLPLVRDLIVELADASVAQRFDALVASGRTLQGVNDELRKRHGISQTPWWGIPTRNTLDRATAMLPQLLYERMDELGLDVRDLVPDLRTHPHSHRRRGVAPSDGGGVQCLSGRAVRPLRRPAHPCGMYPDVHA